MTDTLGEHVRIVYLAQHQPADTQPLGLDAEARVIREQLMGNAASHRYPVFTKTMATTEDLHEALLRCPNAQVLHLAGHGHAERGILGADAELAAVMFTGARLAQVLKTHPNIRLVILGACHQMTHAQDLAEVVACVVGTSDLLGDAVARKFSRSFYRELAFGASIGEAFQRASAFTGLDHGRRADVVQLFSRPGVDPHWVRLIHGSPSERGPNVQSPVGWDRRAREMFQQAVDGTDDVVVSIDLAEPWHEIVPHRPRAAPHVIAERTGIGASRGSSRLDPEGWRQAAATIRDAVAAARASMRGRVHVMAGLPESLSALLGWEASQLRREVVFYERATIGGRPARWYPYGPGLATLRPRQNTEPSFEEALVPTSPIRVPCELALVVCANRLLDPEVVLQATGADESQVRMVHLATRAAVSAHDPHRVDTAADHFMTTFERICRGYPLARSIHVFWAAPRVLLMRVASALHHAKQPVIVYDTCLEEGSALAYYALVDIEGRHRPPQRTGD